MWPLAVALLLLVGCAGTLMDAETLRAEEYERSPVMVISPTGALGEAELYELWVKESREGGRIVRACLVPGVEAVAYNWYLTVLVDGKETWSYQSGPLAGKSVALKRLISCAVSPPLPEGRLNFSVAFRYRQ